MCISAAPSSRAVAGRTLQYLLSRFTRHVPLFSGGFLGCRDPDSPTLDIPGGCWDRSGAEPCVQQRSVSLQPRGVFGAATNGGEEREEEPSAFGSDGQAKAQIRPGFLEDITPTALLHVPIDAGGG